MQMTCPTFEIDSGNGAIEEGQVLGTAKKKLRIQDNFLGIYQEEKVERIGMKERSDGVRGNSILIVMKLMIKLSRGWQDMTLRTTAAWHLFLQIVLLKDSLLSYLQLIYDWFCITVMLISYDAYCNTQNLKYLLYGPLSEVK